MSLTKVTNYKKKHKTKLIFCTYSCVYSSIVLNKILQDDNIEVVAIVNSTRILKADYGAIKGSIKQIQLSGWRYATYLFFITDLFSIKQTAFKLRKQSLKSVHTIAKQHGIPIIDSKDINDSLSREFIHQQQADYLVAAHFNQLIKPEILNMPNLQCINIHPSLLPAYKGVDPVFYALLNHEKVVGVSLHRMAETFDTGEILLQAEQTVDSKKQCLFSLNCQLFAKGAELAIKWIAIIANNDSKTEQTSVLKTASQSTPTDAQYDSWPDTRNIDQFKQSGNKLLCLYHYATTIFSGYKQ